MGDLTLGDSGNAVYLISRVVVSSFLDFCLAYARTRP